MTNRGSVFNQRKHKEIIIQSKSHSLGVKCFQVCELTRWPIPNIIFFSKYLLFLSVFISTFMLLSLSFFFFAYVNKISRCDHKCYRTTRSHVICLLNIAFVGTSKDVVFTGAAKVKGMLQDSVTIYF